MPKRLGVAYELEIAPSQTEVSKAFERLHKHLCEFACEIAAPRRTAGSKVLPASKTFHGSK